MTTTEQPVIFSAKVYMTNGDFYEAKAELGLPGTLGFTDREKMRKTVDEAFIVAGMSGVKPVIYEETFDSLVGEYEFRGEVCDPSYRCITRRTENE